MTNIKHNLEDPTNSPKIYKEPVSKTDYQYLTW